MRSSVKLVLALAVAGLVSYVGLREMRTSCGPTGADAHGHGHGAEGTEAAHSKEGFGTKVCEDGFVAALGETLGLSTKDGEARADNAPGKESAEAPHGHDEKTEEKKDAHGHAHGAEKSEGGEGFVKLSSEQIKAADISIAPAGGVTLIKEIAVPGRIAINANAQADIVPKLTGTVASVARQIGDTVAAGDLLASIESREMADVKSEFLAATRSEELAKSIFVREERLWKQKVTAEQDYLNAKNGAAEAKIKLDQAHQKLHTIGMTEDEIAAFPKNTDESHFRLYEMRSPIAGRVTMRELVAGQAVSTDKKVFTIADLAKVWVEIAISPSDLVFAKEGQQVRVQAGERKADAKVIALSPVIDPDTRSARAVAELDNASGEWQLGDYVNAQLISGRQDVDVGVPRGALQTINGNKVVFVLDGPGFRARPVTVGRDDSQNVEILSGLEFGETVATNNTFTLKAELGKAEAEHEH